MKLDQLFTEYDASIEADACRDPMGLQIIWSTVVQNIFRRSITSISSDMRNFTINLFKHWIVKAHRQCRQNKTESPSATFKSV